MRFSSLRTGGKYELLDFLQLIRDDRLGLIFHNFFFASVTPHEFITKWVRLAIEMFWFGVSLKVSLTLYKLERGCWFIFRI